MHEYYARIIREKSAQTGCHETAAHTGKFDSCVP